MRLFLWFLNTVRLSAHIFFCSSLAVHGEPGNSRQSLQGCRDCLSSPLWSQNICDSWPSGMKSIFWPSFSSIWHAKHFTSLSVAHFHYKPTLLKSSSPLRHISCEILVSFKGKNIFNIKLLPKSRIPILDLKRCIFQSVYKDNILYVSEYITWVQTSL